MTPIRLPVLMAHLCIATTVKAHRARSTTTMKITTMRSTTPRMMCLWRASLGHRHGERAFRTRPVMALRLTIRVEPRPQPPADRRCRGPFMTWAVRGLEVPTATSFRPELVLSIRKGDGCGVLGKSADWTMKGSQWRGKRACQAFYQGL